MLAGQASSPESAARRVSFSELLGRRKTLSFAAELWLFYSEPGSEDPQRHTQD